MAMQTVEIQWVDSKSCLDRWEYLDDLPKFEPALCTTVGFLLKDGKDYKVIAQSLGTTQVHGGITIPTGCIKRIRRLK